MSGVWKHFYLTLVLFIDSCRLVDITVSFLIVFSCYWECQIGQGQSVLLCRRSPQSPWGGFSIFWPLGIFVPADLLTTFVSSLSQSSSPSRLCICFVVFHFWSDMKQSLPPKVRAASTDLPSHFSLFHPERLFLTWGASHGCIFEARLFLSADFLFFFKEKTVSPNIRRIIQTLLGIVDSDFSHLKRSHSADALAK